MTKEQMKQEAAELQDSINKIKEMYNKGEIDHSCFYARLAGCLIGELTGLLGYQFDTNIE